MILRAMVLAAVAMASAGVAAAQVLDARDPSITKKVTLAPKQKSIPEYPLASRRNGESGETVLNTCVASDGSSSNSTVIKSSGSEALDRAALDWMNNGVSFLPAEVGGKPVSICNYQFTYVWTLKTAPSPREPWQDYFDIKKLLASDRPTVTLPAMPPPYPDAGLATRAKGVVSMAFCISPEGRVVNFEVRTLEPGPNFIEPTLRYFLSSKFKPGTPNGRPAGVCGLELSYEWKLPN